MFFRSAVLTIVFAAATVMMASAASAEQAYTTRIEPRPFYGAVVTLEEGVRVIRPLPPERHVIINPDNRTPLSLNFNDTRVYENRQIHNYDHTSGSTSGSSGSRFVYGTNGFFAGGSSGLGRYGAKTFHRNQGGVSLSPARQMHEPMHGQH